MFNTYFVAQQAKKLAIKRHGVAWHSVYGEYRPFQVDGEVIRWWHDPEECGDKCFYTAIRKTYKNVFSH